MKLNGFNIWKKQNGHAVLDNALDAYVLSEKAMANRLRFERLRSERCGAPASLVVIDLPRLLAFLSKKFIGSPELFARHVADVLKKHTRETDIKGYYARGQVGLLAIDTDQSHARVLVDKLTVQLAEHIGVHGVQDKKALKRFFSISILQNHGSYLSENREEPKNAPKSSGTPTQLYRVKFATAARNWPRALGDNEAASVAMAPWPFNFEILHSIRDRGFQLKVKRIMDIIGSLAGIVLFAPVMGIVAVLVKLTSPGPVLFRQERLGLFGQPFTFMKFRSMRVDCDSSIHKEYVTKLITGKTDEINRGTDDMPVFKITDDPRVTPVGTFLRKSSLDELAQFFNVLKGDMSLVGPRPPIPYECSAYKPWHCRRVLEAKPGITGLWQVSGRSTTTFDEMVRMDLKYVQSWNLWLDVKILFKTVWTVVSAKGGY